MATLRTTVTPTLSSVVGYVDDVRDQVASIVRFIILNPGWTSSIWEDKLVSFRVIASKWQNNPSSMTNELAQAVRSVLNRMFDQYGFDCEFTTQDYDSTSPDGRYTVIFKISISSRAANTIDEYATDSALLSGTIHVNNKTNEITIDYDTTQDTLSLTTV